MNEYRIKEAHNGFFIQIKEKNKWRSVGFRGGVAYFPHNPEMPPFKTLPEAQKVMDKLTDGPKYHYPKTRIIGNLNDAQRNQLFYEINNENINLKERINKYNSLPWYKKIFTFSV